MTLVGFSPAAAKLLGPELDQRLGMRIREAFPQVLPERVKLYAKVAREGGTLELGEQPYRDSVLEVKASNLGPGVIAMFIENLTAMRRLTTFLDTIVENLPGMIFVKEAKELRFERFNRAGEELLGVPREQLLGKNDYDFFPKEQADHFQERDRAALASKAVVDIAEEPIQTKTGERWLHTRKVPIVDAAGQPQYLLGISVDITERKAAVEQLKDAVARLEASNTELDAFTYSVSHDLRAPLRAIDGFARVLLEDHGAKLDADGRRVVEVITRNAVKMGKLIDELLAFSKLGRRTIVPQRVDMTALAREAADEVRVTGRSLEIDIAELPGADGEPGLLCQVWANLLSNAVKYTRTRDPAVIRVSGETLPTETVYRVTDNGVGFDPRYRAKLFGVFQRLHSETEYEGVGVGLALVDRIVKKHGGWVNGDSSPGEGATFSFGLPRMGVKEP
ncbi:MAG: PAS domain-containing protein [Myxococcaceae bacterium]|nr:PAS domain-containing protein [Myxococcaceae bacterium]